VAVVTRAERLLHHYQAVRLGGLPTSKDRPNGPESRRARRWRRPRPTPDGLCIGRCGGGTGPWQHYG
jgi:hypothetical protein